VDRALQLSIIVPCLNEAANLPTLVARVEAALAAGGIAGELIVVDDGSRDATWAVMQRLARAHAFVAPWRHAHNRGIVAAWRTGVATARAEVVCVLDADLQYRPEDIPRLRALHAASGADIAQGQRSPVGRAHDSRYWFSRGLNAVLNAAFGMRLRDNKSGFLVCRRAVLEDLLAHRGRYHAWQNLIMVAAHARGYTIAALDVPFLPRRAGRSFLGDVPVRHAVRSLVDVARALPEYRVARGGAR
jgi:glycosyltransferase involved in cell wall biosynthesis